MYPVKNNLVFSILFAGTLCIGASEANGQQSKTWIGTTSTDWFNAGNWSPTGVPAADDTAIIPLTLNTANLSSNTTVAVLMLAGGSVTGSGNLSVSVELSWTGGTMGGAGATNIPKQGVMNISGTATKSLSRRTINNAGTVTWSGGDINCDDGAVFNNQTGGIFDAQSNAIFSWTLLGSTPTFNNIGTFRKTISASTTTFSGVTFINTGTVEAQTGTISFSGGVISGGTFNAGPGTTISFAGTSTFNNGTVFTGAGVNLVTGGSVTLSGTVTSTNFEFAGGTLTNGGTFTGTFNWTGGTISGGFMNVPTGGTLNISGTATKSMSGDTINNAGTVTWSGGDISCGDGAVFNNQTGGIFDAQSNAIFSWTLLRSTPTFNNIGTFRKTISASTTTFSGVTFINTGTVEAQSGTISFSNYSQTAGVTILRGGNIASSSTLNIQAGILSGTGIVTANVLNAGRISPGLSPGVLTISGSYIQTPTGILDVEIGGDSAGLFDKLTITGSAALAGTLDITLTGYVPMAGDSFQVVTFGFLSGFFTTINGLNLGNRVFLVPIYSSTDLTLVLRGPTINETSGNNQSGPISTSLANPLVVTLKDGLGSPVANVDVAFSIDSIPSGATGQTLSAVNAATDTGGRASTVLTLGNRIGRYTVTATSPAVSGRLVTFSAIATSLPYPSTLGVNTTVSFPSLPNASDYKASDYRIVGLPGASDSLMGAFLPGSQNADWQVFWDNGAAADYLEKYDGGLEFRLTVGRAFWLVKKGPWSVSTEVPAAPLDSSQQVEIPLHVGWNLITNPFISPIAWSKIQTIDTISEPIYSYNGTFTTSTDFQPYVGYYFFNATSLLALKISYSSLFSSSSLTDNVAPISWRVNIALSSDGLVDSTTWFGVSSRASAELDPLDCRKPRAIAPVPIAYFDRPNWDANYSFFATDFRPEFEGANSWEFEVRSTERKPSLLAFSGLWRIPSRFQVYLLDEAKASSVNLRIDSLYSFVPATDISRFSVLVGKEDALQERLSSILPREFSLYNNYPNPFNPSTTICVDVPCVGDIKLKVFDLLGREVKTLYSGILSAGRHSFGWDGRDEEGKILSTGVYFYRLTTRTGVNLVGKMVFMK
jgi:hypothetical protein